MRYFPRLRPVSWSLLLLMLFALASSSTLVHAAVPRKPAPISSRSDGITTALTTTGCGKHPPNPPGSSANEMLRSGGLLRYYRLHVPTGYRPTRYTPLVFSFHGHNSDMMAQERLTGFSTLANQQGFLVAYPQGTVGPDGQTGWATGPRKDPTVNDVHFVSDLLTHLQTTLCVDPQRIYATGFSNGGAMTAVLACTMAGRMAAFASVSGSYYPLAGGCHPSRPASIFEMHGTADTVVPYDGSASLRLPPIANWLAAWAQRDGCASQPVPFFQLGNTTAERWSGCQGDSMIVHYRIEGGKHDWPQTISAPGTSLVLTTSGLIWSFLQAHLLLRQE